jgi:hypothetical protein
MPKNDLPPDWDDASIKPPFLYEIRVKGQLSVEQWTAWFDDLTVAFVKSETLLRGRVPDHAALYALLARLRDLAVPLVSVKVIDADAQATMARQNRRYDLLVNLLLVTLYLMLLGGLVAVTVLVSPLINVALVLALLGAALGGLGHAFWLWSGQPLWRWVAYGAFAGSVVAFVIFIPVSGLLPPALGVAFLLFTLAGGLFYLISWLRRYAEGQVHSFTPVAQSSARAEDAVPAPNTVPETLGDLPSADEPADVSTPEGR